MFQSIFTVLLSAISGACYRYGGWEHGKRWVREVGVGICLVLETLLLGLFNWGTLFEMGSVWVETTYFKIQGKVYWILVGLSFSISTLPWLLWGGIVNHHWQWKGYVVRVIVLSVLVYFWQMKWSDPVSKLLSKVLKKDIGKDTTDEVGRGALQILTLPLLLI